MSRYVKSGQGLYRAQRYRKVNGVLVPVHRGLYPVSPPASGGAIMPSPSLNLQSVTWSPPVTIFGTSDPIPSGVNGINRPENGVIVGLAAKNEGESECSIRIKTNQPITLVDPLSWSRNDHISWRNGSGDTTPNINLAVTGLRAYGMPSTSTTAAPGRVVRIGSLRSLILENSEINGSGGMLVDGFTGTDPAHVFRVRFNKFVNINGNRMPSGGVYGTSIANYIQINNCRNMQHFEFGWNYCYSPPGYNIEDGISIHDSSGTPSTPFWVHNNFVRGAHPYYVGNSTHSGSGIMMETGWDATTAKEMFCHDVLVEKNIILETSSGGVNCFSGYDMTIRDNTIVTAARWNNLTQEMLDLGFTNGTTYPYGNAGLGYQNYLSQTNPAAFYNHFIYGNQVAYCDMTTGGGLLRRDFSAGGQGTQEEKDARLAFLQSNNSLYFPSEYMVQTQDEEDLLALYAQRVYNANVKIGVLPIQ